MSDAADKPPRTRKVPVMARLGPYEVRVQEGESYLWCSCGLSATQPWCDGSHEGTGMQPIAFVAPISEVFHMCGCKNSDNKPFCFGNCRGHHRRSRDA